MKPSEGFTDRLVDAQTHYMAARRLRTLNNTDVARLVSAALGREETYTGQAAGLWFAGTQNVDVIWGLARALGVSPSWLAWNEGPMVTEETKPFEPVAPLAKANRVPTKEELRAPGKKRRKRAG